jgi:hypothetical protein
MLSFARGSAISYQLSAISYQLSAISYQLSAISYQLSAISSETVDLGCCGVKLFIGVPQPSLPCDELTAES